MNNMTSDASMVDCLFRPIMAGMETGKVFYADDDHVALAPEVDVLQLQSLTSTPVVPTARLTHRGSE
jgi:hypothetical protein